MEQDNDNKYTGHTKPGSMPSKSFIPAVSPEWGFLIIAAIMGIFMGLVNPPFQAPDEDAHFFRVYQLSEGTIVAEKSQEKIGGWLPQCIYDAWIPFPGIKKVDPATIGKLLKQSSANTPRYFFNFPHTALYSPVAYAPAVLGVGGGRLTGLSVLGQLYAARLATLLGWLAIVFFAIKIIPCFKWVMVMIALMPMTVFLSAAVSADTMTNAFAMLTTALILRSALARTGSIATGEWMAIAAASVLLALTKQLYFPIAAMVFLIPVERFGSWGRKVKLCAAIIGAGIIVNLIWTIMVRHTVTVEAWAKPHEQTIFVLSHPLAYASVLYHGLLDRWDNYLTWFVGTLGWLSVYLPAWIWPCYITVLVLVAFVDGGEVRPLKWREKILVAGICGMTALLVVTSQYISYTAPGAKIINGVQGRYFIPLALSALLFFHNRKLRVSKKIIGVTAMVFCAVILAITCHTLVARYY